MQPPRLNQSNHSALPPPEKKAKGLAAVLKHSGRRENASTVTMASCR